MGEITKQANYMFDGFFYFFGFTDNPSDNMCKDILSESPAQKIKTDLRRVNSDYRKKYVEMRKEIMHIG